ncbi:MAG TPA: hypothetical protein VMR06_09330 [Dokdonella sp.]|uniref:Ig-like domain-containing protein n=1 Tax=Dokdonella sp. TaxID=2291710 RepID=UPI002B7B8244|nr:hypothetical protein [Dokdonella sp.]HUD42180.1 hypothetical protein [Dokdonella sp.]
MLLTSLAPALLTVASAATPAPQLSVQSCQFGEVFVFSTAQCEIEVKNAGREKVRIGKILPSQPTDTIEPSSLSLAPGETAKLKAVIKPEVAVGLTNRMFLLDTGESKSVPTYAYAQGFVGSVLDDPRPTIDLGEVVIGGVLPSRQIELTSRDHGSLRATGIVESPDFVDAKLENDGRTVRVAYKASAPWGQRSDDRIVVSLDTPQQKKVAIVLNAHIVGDVAPERQPVSLGVVRTDADREYFVPLRSRSGKPFRVGKVELEAFKGAKTDVVDCSPAADGCKRIRIKGGKGIGFGPLEGMLRVELPDYGQVLPVRLTATALPPGVEPAEEPSDQAPTAEQKRLMADPKARGANDIREVLKAKVREIQGPPPAGRGPLLKWSVANEEAVYGYVILRGDSEAGPFERINRDTIPAGTFEEGYANAYQWRDTSAVVGQTYWYSIGLINKDGTKDSLTGPQRVVAK